jgi:hypothetical protein
MAEHPLKDWKEAFHKEIRPQPKIETRTLPPFEYEMPYVSLKYEHLTLVVCLESINSHPR